jgi:DNA-binding MarR family transcriptional regulator
MTTEKSDELLSSIRRIIRAVDVHSKNLLKQYGITGPQLIILKEIGRSQLISVSDLARKVSLSQATVTNILVRLEQQGYLQRRKGEGDKRKVYMDISDKTRRIIESNPSLLQLTFVKKFQNLADWEQSLLLSSLQRIASMMDAQDLDAAPHLFSDALDGPEADPK